MATATKKAPKSQKSKQVLEHLNKQTANFGVLYMKLHHYHWYVTGPNFFTLHEKFEALYNETTLVMDELAERMLAIGGKPVSTLKNMLSLASINEAIGGESAEAMVKELVSDLEMLLGELEEAAEAAEESGDAPTADLLVAKQEWLEKTAWMLKAYTS